MEPSIRLLTSMEFSKWKPQGKRHLYSTIDCASKLEILIALSPFFSDCYVGVCGLPEPRKRHATATARFARDCMAKFTEMILKLEITLGPGK